MSYNIWLEIDTGGTEPATVEEVGNYTSNVSPMWYKALGFSLKSLHDCIANDCILVLEMALHNMNANPDLYRSMNPDNGWGSYEGAKEYLGKLLLACKRHPKATIQIWN